jgi:hypothetical protein
LQDLPKIFGRPQVDKDEFSPLFPIRASLQRNANHEGDFRIKPTVVPGVLVNRNLASLMNPLAVARNVLGRSN